MILTHEEIPSGISFIFCSIKFLGKMENLKKKPWEYK